MTEEIRERWGKKIAVAIIHGAGEQKETFAAGLIATIEKEFVKLVKDTAVKECLEIKPIWWADILKKPEDNLLHSIKKYINCSNLCMIDWVSKKLWRFRTFIVSYFADAVAYQPSPTDSSTVYKKVHARVAETLHYLAKNAGEKAPLCVIGHSLGTVIASNYFYDISQHTYDISQHTSRHTQILIFENVKGGESPLEQGKTLALFYTMGCPIALWSIRFPTFNRPLSVPANEFDQFYPSVEGEWINFYEKHDLFSFPLSPLPQYENVNDCEVKIGGWMGHVSPTCHNYYLENEEIAVCIAEGLARTWCEINNRDFTPPERKCSFSNEKCNHSAKKSIRMTR